jgi:ketosteroid isomerase-like protein
MYWRLVEMARSNLDARGERIRAAWNSQDVERVLATYADEFSFVDPDTRGEIADRDGLRRYLKKLFGTVTAHTTVDRVLEAASSNAVTVLWNAAVRRAGADDEVVLKGVDFIVFDRERIVRHEIFFDRLALAPLFAAESDVAGGEVR